MFYYIYHLLACSIKKQLSHPDNSQKRAKVAD